LGLEIERKFLVVSERWRTDIIRSLHIKDHLIDAFPKGKARIRICAGTATLTLKGNRSGIRRSEFNLPLTLTDAAEMAQEFADVQPLEKRRHEVRVSNLVWQVDEYLGPLSGLVTADAEVPEEDHPLVLPTWVGPEITADVRFGSRTLAGAIKQGKIAISGVMAAALAAAEQDGGSRARRWKNGPEGHKSAGVASLHLADANANCRLAE
jgi:adenylate cyclase